jgi:hypothetical protein
MLNDPRSRMPRETEVATERGYYDFMDPDPATLYTMEEAGVVLSRICRFGGRGPRFYSVAEHTVLCDNIAIRLNYTLEQRRSVFLHDVPEAIVGDVTTPLKRQLRDFAPIEEITAAAYRARYDVLDIPALVKKVDLLAFSVEARDFFPSHGFVRDLPAPPVLAVLKPPRWSMEKAARQFAARALRIRLS